MSFDVRFQHPSNIFIMGPSQSGKTSFIYKFLKYRHLLMNPVPKTVIYVYSSQHPLVNKMVEEGIVNKVLKNLPENQDSLEKLTQSCRDGGCILVIDDALSQMRSYLPQIFEVISHRDNCTVLFVTQNAFIDSSVFRRIKENCHYYVVMKHAKNSLKVKTLALQMDSCNIDYIMDAHRDAVKLKKSRNEKHHLIYGYLIMDQRPFANDHTRIRTSIFPDEEEPVCIYKEKSH